MKAMLKNLFGRAKMAAKELTVAIRDMVTNPDTRIETGTFVIFIGAGLMASGVMSKKLAAA